ncbi:hypothetical protein SCP_0701430 [Sparassis crispa]|uniref:Uncharacterized protein n=1 Tax=Sparassis crispa TaxID=139825 RepID=A0A401GRT9_9APHY|nr:hypothetical protein SCP_0701430 [Sparassis crispa]GBE84961.1 hypothetical protein SCP_0701430 [Sparassis crispa]
MHRLKSLRQATIREGDLPDRNLLAGWNARAPPRFLDHHQCISNVPSVEGEGDVPLLRVKLSCVVQLLFFLRSKGGNRSIFPNATGADRDDMLGHWGSASTPAR